MCQLLNVQKVRLRQKKLADAANDYAWRVDPELSSLDAAPALVCSFEEYLKIYAEELNHPLRGQCRFAIETLDGEHIGNCGYFDIDEGEGEAELGIMIGERAYWDKGYGADAVITLLNHNFATTKLKRIYLKTLDWNIRAQKCFEKCGFTPCREVIVKGYRFLIMEIRSPDPSISPRI